MLDCIRIRLENCIQGLQIRDKVTSLRLPHKAGERTCQSEIERLVRVTCQRLASTGLKLTLVSGARTLAVTGNRSHIVFEGERI